MNHNRIEKVVDLERCYPNLLELSLINNQIEEIDIGGMQQLQILDVSNELWKSRQQPDQ